jgi:hypothetical protein
MYHATLLAVVSSICVLFVLSLIPLDQKCSAQYRPGGYDSDTYRMNRIKTRRSGSKMFPGHSPMSGSTVHIDSFIYALWSCNYAVTIQWPWLLIPRTSHSPRPSESSYTTFGQATRFHSPVVPPISEIGGAPRSLISSEPLARFITQASAHPRRPTSY